MMTACAPTVRPSRSLMPVAQLSVVSCQFVLVAAFTDDWQLTTDHYFRDFGLLDVQVGLGLQHFAHLQAVLLLVALRARRPHGRTARSVQQAELDADGVGDFAHDAAEGIDFADEVSFGNAADGGIARHLRDEIDVERKERGLQAHARGGHGGFASGMTGADDDNVVSFGELRQSFNSPRAPLVRPISLF